MSATDPMAGDSWIPALNLATVERQVQQTGAYSALEWLLESGVLPYPAYEQWRHGGVAFLEDAFQADASDWVGRLREGEAQARALGLVNDAQAYHDWSFPGTVHRTLSGPAPRSRGYRGQTLRLAGSIGSGAKSKA